MTLTSLGIVELQINYCDTERRREAVKLFMKSFEVDDTNPLTMKHLAEHLFMTGELDMCEGLCKRAIMFLDKL
jgi:hypothetical protein